MTNQFMKVTRDESKNKTGKIAIIGGGLAGLTAAVFLARNGKNVTIIDKSSKFGGKTRTTMVIDGFYFNQGAHALYADGIGSRFWKN